MASTPSTQSNQLSQYTLPPLQSLHSTIHATPRYQGRRLDQHQAAIVLEYLQQRHYVDEFDVLRQRSPNPVVAIVQFSSNNQLLATDRLGFRTEFDDTVHEESERPERRSTPTKPRSPSRSPTRSPRRSASLSPPPQPPPPASNANTEDEEFFSFLNQTVRNSSRNLMSSVESPSESLIEPPGEMERFISETHSAANHFQAVYLPIDAETLPSLPSPPSFFNSTSYSAPSILLSADLCIGMEDDHPRFVVFRSQNSVDSAPDLHITYDTTTESFRSLSRSDQSSSLGMSVTQPLTREELKEVPSWLESEPTVKEYIEDGNLEGLKTLIQPDVASESVDVVLDNNFTLMTWACHHGKLDIVKYLAEIGASKQHLDGRGLTPMMSGVVRGHFNIVHHFKFTWGIHRERMSSEAGSKRLSQIAKMYSRALGRFVRMKYSRAENTCFMFRRQEKYQTCMTQIDMCVEPLTQLNKISHLKDENHDHIRKYREQEEKLNEQVNEIEEMINECINSHQKEKMRDFVERELRKDTISHVWDFSKAAGFHQTTDHEWKENMERLHENINSFELPPPPLQPFETKSDVIHDYPLIVCAQKQLRKVVRDLADEFNQKYYECGPKSITRIIEDFVLDDKPINQTYDICRATLTCTKLSEIEKVLDTLRYDEFEDEVEVVHVGSTFGEDLESWREVTVLVLLKKADLPIVCEIRVCLTEYADTRMKIIRGRRRHIHEEWLLTKKMIKERERRVGEE